MPEPNDKDKGAGGDNNGAGAGAGAGGDEEITIKKSELEKIKSDSENYKTMGNKYKEGSEKWEAYQKELADKNNQNHDQNKNNSGQIDESKVGDIARKTLRDSNERSAKQAFFSNHPEYNDEAQRNALLAELHFKGTELTVEEINDRLEAALLEHKRKTGKLDEYMNSEKERARRDGRIEGQMNQAHGINGAGGDKNEKDKEGTLSPKGEEMARAMHTDPEKAKKVDIKKDNVIDVLAKKSK